MRVKLLVISFKIMSLMAFIIFSLDLSVAISQRVNTAASWHLIEYGNRIAALGQASSALDNRIAFHVNPAIPVKSGTINLSSYLISSEPAPIVNFDEILYNPSASIGLNKWALGVKMDYTQWSRSNTETSKTRILRFNLSRELFNNFNIGLGVSHIHDEDLTSGFNGDPANGFMFSTGIHYKYPFPLFGIKLNPQVGIALTDIGDKLSYNIDGKIPQTGESISGTNFLTPPGQLRASFGLDIATQEKIANQHFVQVGFYFGFNKYMSGFSEKDNSDGTYSLISGFDMVTSTWKSFDRFNGISTDKIGVIDQISTSYGIEIGLMETLFFQIGTISGADLWVRPQKNFGVTLDLFYVSLSYTNLDYENSEQWRYNNWSTPVWSLDVRIPFGEASHNTLLESFIPWLKN